MEGKGRGTGKQIVKRTEEGFRIQAFAKGEYQSLAETGTDDLTAVINIGLQALENIKHTGGIPPTYARDESGLQAFANKVVEYFDKINEINSKLEQQKVYPDVESLCLFLGITRRQLGMYADRDDRWRYVIETAKQAVTAAKKQLASSYKIPPVFAIFDLTNNSGYLNSSEFKLVADTGEMQGKPRLSKEEILQLDDGEQEIGF